MSQSSEEKGRTDETRRDMPPAGDDAPIPRELPADNTTPMQAPPADSPDPVEAPPAPAPTTGPTTPSIPTLQPADAPMGEPGNNEEERLDEALQESMTTSDPVSIKIA